ncbi:MAG TPA: BON domain-containing protein [Polyangiaceae bacterium]|jgi:osmotically-inducible protein OsmY|nr:BON domain-containing protein [Polyangiaceae bacterium]
MNRTIPALFLLCLAGACNRSGTDRDRDLQISAAKPAEQDKVVPDKTKINEHDSEAPALAPGDRGETAADRTITLRIRQGLLRENALSSAARNVNIITTNGSVTLRGSVTSASQKMEIGRIAQGTEGANEVDNQLDVAEQLGG